MLSRLSRHARRLHDNLVFRFLCSPETGFVGVCERDPYKQHGLGLRASCVHCKREMRP